MSTGSGLDNQGSSTRPYLLRALHDWCTDNGFTPYVAVHVDASVKVPVEYVKNNEIVLNVGFEATSGLKLGNQFIEFKARFGGVSREIVVPVDHVVAIYARENGQGMAFPMPAQEAGPAGAGEHGGAAASLATTGGAPPLRGLRLARRGSEAAAGGLPSKAVTVAAPAPRAAGNALSAAPAAPRSPTSPALSPAVSSVPSGASTPPPAPPAPSEPPEPGSPRPSLKRVK